MSNGHLMWIGYSSESGEQTLKALAKQFDKLSVEAILDATEALRVLARDPGKHQIVIINARSAGAELAPLATGVKQINPAIEIIVIRYPGLDWENLTLPRYYRPILLDESSSPDVLISCVAKLQEMVEAKEDYDKISRGFGDRIGMSRTSTEAVLALLSRQNCLGMISMRRDGFFTSYNAEAERLTGYTIDELAHIQVWANQVLLDRESVRALLDSISMFWARKTGRENMRLKIRRKDGLVLTLSMTAVVLLDNYGQARQIAAFFFDPLATGAAYEYELLMNSGACGVYTYIPEIGFTKMSVAALNLLNLAFSFNLTNQDVLNKRIVDLPLPRETAESWQHYLEEMAAGSASATSFGPLGLPGRRILDHTFVARVPTGARERFGALAVVVPREDLPSDGFESASAEMLAQKTLNAISRPFLLLRAHRDEAGYVKDFKCLSMNVAGLKALGLEAAFRSGMPIEQIFKDAEALETLFGSAIEVAETGKNTDFEIRITLNAEGKGTERALVKFWLGKVGDGAAVFFKDVTTIRQEESHLKQYRHIFSHMEEAIIVTDLVGNIIDWNPASERMFGYTKEQILGKSVFVLTPNPDGVQLKQHSSNVLRDGDVWKGEYEFVRGDGSRGIAFSVFALLKDDRGMAYGSVGLCHDLTERKRLEEMLTVKNQELQEKNLALNTLLRHAETERMTACERVVADLARRINDRLSRILDGRYKPQTVETHAKLLLQELGVAPKPGTLDRSDPTLKLTEKELEVARLIRLGKTTEEIAFILNKSPDTIRLQRISIRKRLGLARKDRNLAGYLKKMDFT
ncbi:MAG: PAS domain S-box protein [Desulfomonilaceae bacterium]